ncbi:hypothetical protein BLW95_07240 [Lacticaseibacillus paracasei]|nr:hypothetical protein BLW95_07240 [Lacticaseibacillus paracasei]
MEIFTIWVAVFIAEAVVTVGTVGKAVVVCGYEVSYGIGVVKFGEILIDAGIVIFFGFRGFVGRDVRQSVLRRLYAKFQRVWIRFYESVY